jgi:hypothetical protein
MLGVGGVSLLEGVVDKDEPGRRVGSPPAEEGVERESEQDGAGQQAVDHRDAAPQRRREQLQRDRL